MLNLFIYLEYFFFVTDNVYGMVPRQQQKHSVENIAITRDSSVKNTMIFENSRAVSQTEAGELSVSSSN